ncbi:hypothetical protein [Glycomyces xiaoerkulensis]|uniref:hypothetical protein n=1 Tax=Glycomyces xiaoerkulensis TaxID=2038139 RepID=UPI0018E4A6CE|nr:hypothetical protein [Glycomyces xiaoerkulensis]
MLDPNWVFLSAGLGLLGSLRYAHATLTGRAYPNRVTWVLWAAAPLIGFFAQLDEGVGLTSVQTLAAGVNPLIVVAASFISRHGAVRITGFDLVCGAISVAALAVWLGLGQAPLAVLFAALADGSGGVPTLRKAWRDPHSENAFFYGLVVVAATITLLTVDDWRPASWMFAGYLLTLGLLFTTVIAGRRLALRGAGRLAPAEPPRE